MPRESSEELNIPSAAQLANWRIAERVPAGSRPQSFVSKVERGERRLDVIKFFEVADMIGFDPFAFLRAMQKAGGDYLKANCPVPKSNKK
jgi:hypothetical protein